MKEFMDMMEEGNEEPSKASLDQLAKSFADKIKEGCAGAGEDLNHVMVKVNSLLKGEAGEEEQEHQNEVAGNYEEGSQADDKAPKKAMIVAMLKKKNSEG